MLGFFSSILSPRRLEHPLPRISETLMTRDMRLEVLISFVWHLKSLRGKLRGTLLWGNKAVFLGDTLSLKIWLWALFLLLPNRAYDGIQITLLLLLSPRTHTADKATLDGELFFPMIMFLGTFAWVRQGTQRLMSVSLSCWLTESIITKLFFIQNFLHWAMHRVWWLLFYRLWNWFLEMLSDSVKAWKGVKLG